MDNENSRIMSCNMRVWRGMSPEDRESFVLQQIEAKPGSYNGCIATNNGLYGSIVRPTVMRLLKQGKLQRYQRTMRIAGRDHMIKSIFPSNMKLSSNDLKNSVAPIKVHSCRVLWYNLDRQMKIRTILRYISSHKNGIPFTCMSAGLGVDVSNLHYLCNEMKKEGFVIIENAINEHNDVVNVVRITPLGSRQIRS